MFISNIAPVVSYYLTPSLQAGSNQLVKPVDPAEARSHGHQAAYDAAAAERKDSVRVMLQRCVFVSNCFKFPANLLMGFTGTMRSKATLMLLSQNSMARSQKWVWKRMMFGL